MIICNDCKEEVTINNKEEFLKGDTNKLHLYCRYCKRNLMLDFPYINTLDIKQELTRWVNGEGSEMLDKWLKKEWRYIVNYDNL